MKSISALLFLFSAAAAFSLRSIPVATKRIFLSANMNTVTEQVVCVIADEVPDPPCILKRMTISLPFHPTSSLVPLLALLHSAMFTLKRLTNLSATWLPFIATSSEVSKKKSIWSMFFRYIGSAVRRIGRRHRESSTIKEC
jgi:hypothetical protein